MSKKRRTLSTFERPTLQLENRHFSRIKHGLEVIGTWYQNEDTRWRWKPCLVLLPQYWPPTHRPVPCIIPLENAWKWALHGDVGDPEHVLMMIAYWFDEGFLPGAPFNKRDHMRVMDAVNDSLPDLIAMPPRPKGEQVAIADIKITRSGEVVEREILNDV